MSAALLRIAKLIPRLGGASVDAERLMALRLIEKALLDEGMTFVDAGIKLGEFVTDVLGTPEPEPVVHKPAQSAPGWNSPRAQQAQAQPARPQSSAGWTAPHNPYTANPPPPRPPPPPRAPTNWGEWFVAEILRTQTAANQDDVLNKHWADRAELLLNRKSFRNAKEKQFLEDMFFRATSGFNVKQFSQKQIDWFYTLANRLPI